MRVLYQNARMVDARGESFGSLLTEDGEIRYAGPSTALPCDQEVDAGGNVLMPAFIDMHCHLRDPGYPEKETMESGMRAALKGGYSYVCAMANTLPIMETAELVRANHERAGRLRLCGLMQAAAAGVGLRDDQPTDYRALCAETRLISNDGNTILSEVFMRQLLAASARYDFVVSTHCQPERETVRRDISLLREVGGNLHIGHISHRETVDMIREAKAQGLILTCEVTPHHLFGYNSDYRVNPPLRTEEDAGALIEGLRDGTVDCLSTDHAPHTRKDKSMGAPGISNIEYAIQIYLQVCLSHDIPLTRLSELTSFNPARRLNIPGGLLAAGHPANIVLLDTEERYELSREELISKSDNTPFIGRTVRGRVLRTVVEGELRYEYRPSI